MNPTPDATAAESERPSGRSFLLDLLKAVGCVLIVLHHLAFYGPMSHVLAQRWPDAIEVLADHGRLAVQLFLVCSGYLTAAALRPRPAMDLARLSGLIGRRYLRLATPLMVALGATVLITEGIRPPFQFPSLSATPEWPQMLAHVLLLQHLADMEALSAGVWYVAIDFQLYGLTLLVFWGVALWQRWRPDWSTDALLLQVMLAQQRTLVHVQCDAKGEAGADAEPTWFVHDPEQQRDGEQAGCPGSAPAQSHAQHHLQ